MSDNRIEFMIGRITAALAAAFVVLWFSGIDLHAQAGEHDHAEHHHHHSADAHAEEDCPCPMCAKHGAEESHGHGEEAPAVCPMCERKEAAEAGNGDAPSCPMCAAKKVEGSPMQCTMMGDGDSHTPADTAHHGSHGHHDHGAQPHDGHAMWMTELGGGWHLMGMAHVFPAATLTAPFSSESPLNRTDINFPHSGLMANLESPGSRWVFRLMPNFEGITLPDGEPTLGGWGEGFIDARHPHTLLHEAMLSWNWWDAPGGAFSVSAGRGFAPYGTEDPMYRPALKYPTNHHLSQILERWTVNLSYLSDAGLGIEVGVFDGDEPEHWLDMGNYRNFGNSFSGRLSYRFGETVAGTAPWEVSASYGHVRETHGDHDDLTILYNAALRHDAAYGFGSLYGLAEASLSDPDHGDGYFSLLGETQLGLGAGARHRPFYRVEFATRPEYRRDAQEGQGFFRYDHDHAPIEGATRWLINTVGYGFEATGLPVSARPFVEASHNLIRHERGPDRLEPANLFGGSSFWSFAAGVRLYFGGGPMRMGTYGVMDPMTLSMREMEMHDHPMMHEDHEHHPMPHREEHEHHEHEEAEAHVAPEPEEREDEHAHPEREATPEHVHPQPEVREREEDHDHPMHDRAGMHRAMGLVVRLLDDTEVQRRIHAVPEYHEAWEDEAVQRQLAMLREMHGDDVPHEEREHRAMVPDEGAMQRAMGLVVRLLDDPEVQRRIHAVPDYHEAWQDPEVQDHIAMMRRMHEDGEDGAHPHDPSHHQH